MSRFSVFLLVLALGVSGPSLVFAESEPSSLAEQFFAKGLGYYWDQDLPQHYDEAFVWLSKAAENGHPRAQAIVADMYNNGLGTQIDYRKGWAFSQASASQGDSYGRFLLGKALYKALGTERDSREGTRILSQAMTALEVEADSGDVHAQSALAWIYYHLSTATKDYQKARHWYEKAAVQGYAVAQNDLGFMFGRGDGVRKNSQAKMVWYRRAADQGYPVAQYNVALALEHEGDLQSEYEMFRLAANRDYAPAQTKLGWFAEQGKGRPRDLKKAVSWYRKAATQGHQWAQNHLGSLYESGNGVTQNYQEAMKWYRRAAENQYDSAFANIAHLYEQGLGVEQDYVTARTWYERGAKQNDSHSQARLGYLYLYGYGVKQDLKEAQTWLLKAARGGDEWAYYGIGLIHEQRRKYWQAIRWHLLSAINGYGVGFKRAVYLMVLYPVISFRA